MLARRFLQQKQLVNLRCGYMLTRCTHQAADAETLKNYIDYFTHPEKKSARREPFAKGLFLGKLDVEFLAFPEPHEFHRYAEFTEWLKPIEEYVSMCVKHGNVSKREIISELRKLGVFRAAVAEDYRGLNLLETEMARLVETVSAIPWLGVYLVQNCIVPAHLIAKYGSTVWKEKYLPKIASGEMVPTLCSSESIGGTNVFNMRTTAKLFSSKKWVLNGEKTVVFNAADSNLFVVIAHSSHANMYASKNDLCMAIVERDFGGISNGSKEELVGHRETSVSTVTFKETVLPAENIMQQSDKTIDILKDILSPGKQNMAAVAIGVLRSFIGQVTTNVMHRSHMDQNMYEFDCVKECVGKLTSSLYGMESALYLTAGIADTFENQDLELEKAITETHCANECINSIQASLQTIGVPAYLRKNPFFEALENALLFSTFSTYNMDAKTYIALLGLQHSGKHTHETIFRSRNPFSYPYEVLKTSLFSKKEVDLEVPGHLHLSFKQAGKEAENCVFSLKNSVASMFSHHGTQVANHHLDLCRLSDIASQTYVTLASLSRASRSYCIGVKNSEYEKMLAITIAHKTHDNVRRIVQQIDEGPYENGDSAYKRVADEAYKTKGYFVENALSRVM